MPIPSSDLSNFIKFFVNLNVTDGLLFFKLVLAVEISPLSDLAFFKELTLAVEDANMCFLSELRRSLLESAIVV